MKRFGQSPKDSLLRLLALSAAVLICLSGAGCRHEKTPSVGTSTIGTEPGTAPTLPENPGPEITDTVTTDPSDTTTGTGAEDTTLTQSGGTTAAPRPGTTDTSSASSAATTAAPAGRELPYILEAEDGLVSGGVRTGTSRSGYSGTGYVTNFKPYGDNKASKWYTSVTVPASGHYTLTVRCTADAARTLTLRVNGLDIGESRVKAGGGFYDISYTAVWLEKGLNRLSVTQSAGGVDLDRIVIDAGAPLPSSLYQNITSTPCNPNANAKTRRIMQYLADIYGKKMLSGQYTNGDFVKVIDNLYKLTGKYPALRGFDFLYDSPSLGRPGGTDTQYAIQWSRDGGLVTFSWHWIDPLGGDTYASDAEFDLSRAVTGIDIAGLSAEEVRRLADEGRVPWETWLLIRDIDAISEQLKILQNNNVTVLWRPLHEASGGWFWWGCRGKDAYLWLWNLLYERQTDYHKLNNLIWVWNGQDPDWYVGDDRCDIIGEDVYADARNYDAQAMRFMNGAAASPRKMVALTENGVMTDPDRMARDGVYWSWFNIWVYDFITDSYGNIVDTYTEKSMIYKVYQSDLVVTRDELPASLR